MKNQNRNLSMLMVVVLTAILFSTIWGVSEGRVVKAAPPVQIETADVYTTTLLSEGFENSFPPSGWFREAVTGTSGHWARYTDTVYPSGGGTHSGSYLAYFYAANYGDTARLFTTNLNFAVAGSYYLKFWMFHDQVSSSFSDYLQIEVNNGSGWTEVGDAIYRYDGTQGWSQHTIDLSAYAGQVIKVSLMGVGDGQIIHIDDVLIYAQTASPFPTSVYVYFPLVQKSGSQVTPTITPIRTPTHTPVPSGPKSGTWVFTSMALPVGSYINAYFYVGSNNVGYMRVDDWTWINLGWTCQATLEATGTSIIGNAFSFSGYNFNGNGTFSSTTSANGTFNVNGDWLPYAPCGSFNYTNRSWSASWASSNLP